MMERNPTVKNKGYQGTDTNQNSGKKRINIQCYETVQENKKRMFSMSQIVLKKNNGSNFCYAWYFKPLSKEKGKRRDGTII